MKRLVIIPVALLFLRCGIQPDEALSGEDRAQYLRQIGVEKILLTDAREGTQHLYVLDNVSTKARKITTTPAARTGLWSPDGRRIAYLERGGSASANSLNVMKEDGTDVRQFVNYPSGPIILAFRWSPDGALIAFRVGPPTGSIYTVRADGAGLTEVDAPWLSTQGFDLPGEPAWSPDGRLLAYEAKYPEDALPQVYVINADGTGRRRLSSAPNAARDPSWSPDGRRIVFTSGVQVYTVNADGTGQQEVAGVSAYTPVWSPKGDAIALLMTNGNLGVVSPTGAGFHTIVALSSGESALFRAWSPDGSRIVFLGSFANRPSLYVVRASGGDLRNLVDDVGTFDVKWK